MALLVEPLLGPDQVEVLWLPLGDQVAEIVRVVARLEHLQALPVAGDSAAVLDRERPLAVDQSAVGLERARALAADGELDAALGLLDETAAAEMVARVRAFGFAGAPELAATPRVARRKRAPRLGAKTS